MDIVSTTILKEAGYNKPLDSYNAVAWVIYNRMNNPGCGGNINPYPANAKDNTLRIESSGKASFEVNENFKNLGGCIKKSDIYKHPQGYPVDTSSPSFNYASQISLNLVLNKPPSAQDPTGNKIFFGDANYKNNPSTSLNGVMIPPIPNCKPPNCNWFYDTPGTLQCLQKPVG